MISPGPGSPSTSGICLELVRNFYKDIPILGVCLGHQVIAEAFGGNIIQAKNLVHGKTDTICHDEKGIFTRLPQDFRATRYHSLMVAEDTLPCDLLVTARSGQDQSIMGIRHVKYPIEGLQFHPESYLTSHGALLMINFIQQCTHGGNNV